MYTAVYEDNEIDILPHPTFDTSLHDPEYDTPYADGFVVSLSFIVENHSKEYQDKDTDEKIVMALDWDDLGDVIRAEIKNVVDGHHRRGCHCFAKLTQIRFIDTGVSFTPRYAKALISSIDSE